MANVEGDNKKGQMIAYLECSKVFILYCKSVKFLYNLFSTKLFSLV